MTTAARHWESEDLLEMAAECYPSKLTPEGCVDLREALKDFAAILDQHVHLSTGGRDPDERIYSKKDVQALIAVTMALKRHKQPPEASALPDTGITHVLKCWPEHFAAVQDGSKPFEVRHDDRGFAVGDTLRLREWDYRTEEYTGRDAIRRVTYLTAWGQPEGQVVMGIAPAPPRVGEAAELVDPELWCPQCAHPRDACACGQQPLEPPGSHNVTWADFCRLSDERDTYKKALKKLAKGDVSNIRSPLGALHAAGMACQFKQDAEIAQAALDEVAK